jgi:hypothetical protein
MIIYDVLFLVILFVSVLNVLKISFIRKLRAHFNVKKDECGSLCFHGQTHHV